MRLNIKLLTIVAIAIRHAGNASRWALRGARSNRMMSSMKNEIETAKRISAKQGAIIVCDSDVPGIYNTFSAKFKSILEGAGYHCVFETHPEKAENENLNNGAMVQ